MTERARQQSPDGDEEPVDAGPTVRAHESCPGRVVFTEEGNTDAWLSSDLTVDPEP